jgi:hypothetical protein
MIHDRIMHIPAVYRAKNVFTAATDATNLINNIKTDLFFTTSALAPIACFHKSSLIQFIF